MSLPLNQTAVVGIGQTEFSKHSGRSPLQLAAEASRAAMLDAGLSPSDIDGMVTFQRDENDELELARSLGIPLLRFTGRAPFGGAGSCATIQIAAAAVASGAARAVLIYRAFNERSGHRFGQPGSYPAPGQLDIHGSFGLDTPAKIYALWYQRYMHKYGVTNEDLGRYVVLARKHAATNPAAWYYRKPITLADHQASRWIVEPILRLLDCCQESDGGVALVVTSAERAGDLRQPGVRIVATSQAHSIGGDIMFDYYRPELEDFEEARVCTEELWRQSGLGPRDIDVALIYENFSPIVFLALEAHGFCGPGEARHFIADGHGELTGSLPLNTNGGLLGEGYIHGVNNLLEGVRQIRGTAANQVVDAEHVLVSASRSNVIFGKL
ncbi:MAG: lipid-transfer protein [Deltaproteobacteria bacterium]|nr:lipid-transfer protein [Deltaproteobacteria bacterium]